MNIIKFPEKVKITDQEKFDRELINQKIGTDKLLDTVKEITQSTQLYLVAKMMDMGYPNLFIEKQHEKMVSHLYHTMHATIASFFGVKTDYYEFMEIIDDIREDLIEKEKLARNVLTDE